MHRARVPWRLIQNTLIKRGPNSYANEAGVRLAEMRTTETAMRAICALAAMLHAERSGRARQIDTPAYAGARNARVAFAKGLLTRDANLGTADNAALVARAESARSTPLHVEDISMLVA